ncbi:NuA4 histone H4 acetyltransferase complex and the SWR1 complex subunit [Malassezia cuniculi]|uniref:Protein AF-9 homolog n=1 Tax=Malassezia cuniculi TaxID=948313 RepID=A0AAF0EXB8_9BASI|nr:NuA4 histone H4 acetyltransferase complex and the SWR1 complex subunit [Malassezia cuniculi]
MSKRVRGIAVSRPILIGSTATLLTPAEKLAAPPDHTHKWTVSIRSASSAPLPPLPTAAERDAAATSSTGAIGTRMRDAELDVHRAVGGRDDLSYFIKRVQFRLHETYAQPTRNVDRSPFSVTETGWGEFEVQIKIFFVPESGEKPLSLLHHLKLHAWQSQPSGETSSNTTAPPTPAPVVHSWQYDEIVFPEPLEAFYDILMAHPPTPLPATTAGAYADSESYNEYIKKRDNGEKVTPPHPLHTPTGQVLEAFSLEAQRNEADRLDLARTDAVRQLNADRERLIMLERLIKEARAQLPGVPTV